MIEKNNIESQLYDITSRASGILQDSEEIDDNYKKLEKMYEPTIISLFGSGMEINLDGGQANLEFDDLASVFVPFLQLDFLAADLTSTTY